MRAGTDAPTWAAAAAMAASAERAAEARASAAAVGTTAPAEWNTRPLRSSDTFTSEPATSIPFTRWRR